MIAKPMPGGSALDCWLAGPKSIGGIAGPDRVRQVADVVQQVLLIRATATSPPRRRRQTARPNAPPSG